MTTATVACDRSGCTGTIVDGYCDTCGLAPAKRASRGAGGTAALGPGLGRASTSPA